MELLSLFVLERVLLVPEPSVCVERVVVLPDPDLVVVAPELSDVERPEELLFPELPDVERDGVVVLPEFERPGLVAPEFPCLTVLLEFEPLPVAGGREVFPGLFGFLLIGLAGG